MNLPTVKSARMGVKTMDETNTQDWGLANPEYDLVSVLHHATREAAHCDQFIQDATERGQQELADFFREVREEDRRRAMRARELIKGRL